MLNTKFSMNVSYFLIDVYKTLALFLTELYIELGTKVLEKF